MSEDMEKQGQEIRQTAMTLPYFDFVVPVLYLENGTPYILVIALCEMLGLQAATHIQRWRKLVLWANARKLPLRTARGKQIVWCLHMGALPFWFACFNWSLVNPERRVQLHQAADEWLSIIEQTQQVILTNYKYMRRLLFAFLIDCADTDTKLNWFVLYLSPHLSVDSCMQLERIVFRGPMLVNEATAYARKMLHEQATIPIVDAIKVDLDREVTETFSLPFFKMMSRYVSERFFEYICMLTQWYQEMVAFLEEESLP
jgi:hypothetical protein